MQLLTVFGLFVTLLRAALVVAVPSPGYERVLVVYDDTNTAISAADVADPLTARGYTVEVVGVREHPQLMQYGERAVDSVVVLPGKTKALGSTLKAATFLDFMRLGGNVIALTTPTYSPVAIREAAAQLGIQVSSRGVELVDSFDLPLTFPVPSVLNEFSGKWHGSAVATLDENELTLGLARAPPSAYAYNAAKDEDEPLQPLKDVFALGEAAYPAAALQSRHGSRFVWLGTADFLRDAAAAEKLTKWAFQETGRLRLTSTEHRGTNGPHHHYSVDEPLHYCAHVEAWEPELGSWIKYDNAADIQLEFRMLDPYYRLHLDSDGCASFVAPEQYGMFTFLVDYKRPGLTYLTARDVVTIRHRANDEWARSWAITNSWVYLGGVTTTAMGFLVFVALYLGLPAESAAPKSKPKPKSAQTPVSKPATHEVSAPAKAVVEPEAKEREKPKRTRVRRTKN